MILKTDWKIYRPEGEDTPGVTLGNELRVVRQRVDDADPDRQVPGAFSGQHTWNRLIADFVTAVRNSDVKHAGVPLLPHIADGLAAQKVIVACERSHTEKRWVELE